MSKFKMVMFDMDGTLLNSFRFHVLCFQRFLQHYGARLTEEQVGQLIGNTLKSILSRTIPEEKHADALKRLALFYRYKADDLIEGLKFMAGALETVQQIRRQGLYTALLTNSKKELVDKIIEIKRLKGMFDMVEAADDHSLGKTGRCTKILSAFGLVPQEVLYVGDSSYDIVLANETGMKGCLVDNPASWIHKEKQKRCDLRIDFTVSDIAEVIGIL